MVTPQECEKSLPISAICELAHLSLFLEKKSTQWLNTFGVRISAEALLTLARFYPVLGFYLHLQTKSDAKEKQNIIDDLINIRAHISNCNPNHMNIIFSKDEVLQLKELFKRAKITPYKDPELLLKEVLSPHLNLLRENNITLSTDFIINLCKNQNKPASFYTFILLQCYIAEQKNQRAFNTITTIVCFLVDYNKKNPICSLNKLAEIIIKLLNNNKTQDISDIALSFPKLNDKYKTLCYINCAVYFLRYINTEDELNEIKTLSTSSEKPSTLCGSLCQLSRLVTAMITPQPESEASIDEIWKDFVEQCFHDRSQYFKDSVGLKGRRRQPRKIDKTFILKNLEQNDANEFLISLESLIDSWKPSPRCFRIISRASTSYEGHVYSRQLRGDTVPTNELCIRIGSDGDIERGIRNFLAKEQLDDLFWEATDTLPEGKYTSQRERTLCFHGEYRRFRIYLGQNWGLIPELTERQGLKAAIDFAFKPIQIPIQFAGGISNTTAFPLCVIAHCGDNRHSGHYIIFVRHRQGWVLAGENEAKVIDEPELFLKGQGYHPHTIGYTAADFSHAEAPPTVG